MLFDQTLINLCLLGAAVGRDLSLNSTDGDPLEQLVDVELRRPYR